MTDTGSDKDKESRGQGSRERRDRLLGGMAGCAMIGQSTINIKPGGRTRLSTFSAGFFLLVLILAFAGLIAVIPMAAPVAVIFVVAGVVLAAIFFAARRVAHLAEVTSVLDPDGGQRVYAVTGELLFASTNELVHAFDYADPTPKLVIDLTDAHVSDSSAPEAAVAVRRSRAPASPFPQVAAVDAATPSLDGSLERRRTDVRKERAVSDSEHVQIGDVAVRTGLSLRTVRWYEEVGLVPPSARTQPANAEMFAQSPAERRSARGDARRRSS